MRKKAMILRRLMTRIRPGRLNIPFCDGQKDRDEYVRLFEKINHLKPCGAKWITPTLGNFG